VSAPDFYFAVNATFRYLHEHYGKDALVHYWRRLGREHYSARWGRWKKCGLDAIAVDWRKYFEQEPGADVEVIQTQAAVVIEVRVCPAIKHLRDHQRPIVPYFCEHCDHICGAMADAAGYTFERTGGMGSCRQRFVQLSVKQEAC
jgi:hypothetical protein